MSRPSLRRTPTLESLETRQVLSTVVGPTPDQQYALELINLVRTDVVVVRSEVQLDRAGGLLRRDLADAAGVVADRSFQVDIESLGAGCAEPGEEAAVAESDDAGTVARACNVLSGGCHVE